MSYFEKALITSKVRNHLQALDADPSKWPVAPGVREYMVDCEVCSSRMSMKAIGPHTRRHMRRGELRG